MKKYKNLENSFADRILFTTYFLGLVFASIIYNEILIVEREAILAMKGTKIKAIVKDKKANDLAAKFHVFKLKVLRGEIDITEPESVIADNKVNTVKKKNKKKYVEGDLIKSGSTIKTNEQSFAILSFGPGNKSLMKIGKNTELILTYDEVEKKKPTTLFEQATDIVLDRGNVLLDIKDKYKKDTFAVRTKNAVMGVRGTIFLVSYDKVLQKVAAAVEKGKVAMFNIKSKVLSELKDGDGLMILKSGLDISLNLSNIAANFNLFDEKKRIVDDQALKDIARAQMKIEREKAKAKEQAEEEKRLEAQRLLAQKEANLKKQRQRAMRLKELSQRFHSLVGDFDQYLEAQSNAVSAINHKNEMLFSELQNEEKSLKVTKVKIEKDLVCLQSSAKRCNLLNRKLLVSRGYPRIIFNSKSKASMGQELLRYVDEKEKLIKELKQSISQNEKKVEQLTEKIEKGKQAKLKISNSNYKENLSPAIRLLLSGTQAAGANSIYDDVKAIEKELDD